MSIHNTIFFPHDGDILISPSRGGKMYRVVTAEIKIKTINNEH
jgi:hypothetical protein